MLVHADGAGQHPGADVAGAHHLEQALDGAVLAERPVQQGDRHVHRAQSLQRRRLAYGQLRAAGSAHQHRVGASSVSSGSRPSVTAKLAMRPGSTTIQRPDRVMPIPTTSYRSRSNADHPGGRQAGHRVLAARSAEHHGDPGAGRRGGRDGSPGPQSRSPTLSGESRARSTGLRPQRTDLN